MAYLIPLTTLQRTRLIALLQEVKGCENALDAVLALAVEAQVVSDQEARQRIAMETDESTLDWDWIEELRLEWSQASVDEWTTAEVLAVVFGSKSKSLWQPRST